MDLMKYLKGFLGLFGLTSKGSATASPSAEPLQIEAAELLAKFIRRSKEVRGDGSLREASFTPKRPPYTRSVFRTDRMHQAEIDAAEARVMINSGKTQIYGTANFTKAVIDSVVAGGHKLSVEPEESEHKWHADIHWPNGDGPDSKAVRTQLSHQLLKQISPVTLKVPLA